MLLELLINPTSSIVFQRIKPLKQIMKEKPRDIKESILSSKNIISSIPIVLLIFLVVFITYFIFIHNNISTNLSITITYTILVLSIMLITYQLKGTDLTLKSFIQSIKDKVSLFINLRVIIGLTMFIYIPFFNNIANTITLELK